MNKRDVVKTALEGREPPYVPWNYYYTVNAQGPLVEHFGSAEAMDRVMQNHFVEVRNRFGPHETDTPGFFLDAWGALWDRTLDRDIGNVANKVLPEPTLRGYAPPDPLDPRIYAPIAGAFAAHPDCFRVFRMSMTLWERAWILRGMEDLMVDLYENPGFVGELLDAIVEYDMAQLDEIAKYDFDAVFFMDDWGMQTGLQIGAPLWREFIGPRMEKLIRHARRRGLFTLLHSCGKVQELFDDLAGYGLNCFNPFQPEVMDVLGLMRRYRGRLSFYGGLSTQQTLPYGTPDEVRREAAALIEQGRGGGYVFAPAHAVNPDVPIENIMAYVELLQSQPGAPSP